MGRREIVLIASVFFAYLFHVNFVAAISFTASITPSGTNASDANILVNFTISHSNTTANITQLNITLPSGFSYSGSIGDDATTSGNDTITEDTSVGIIKWTNTSSAGFTTGINRFWFEIDAPGLNATFNFNVSVRDTTGIITSVNATFKLLDTIAPQLSSNTTSPSSGSKYVKNRTYEFSATWTDRISVDTVLIEHNLTGTLTNYTMAKSGNTYIYNFTDLPVGLYVWRMYANDTNNNNVNKSDQYQYNVSKTDNLVEIFFNGNRNTDLQTSNETALNVTANASVGTIFIYRNNNLVISGSPPQTSLDSLPSGTYAYKANATGNQNYSDNSTGINFTVSLSGPAPKWSGNTTSLPSSYSNSTVSMFEVAWTDKADSNGFNTAIIEINYTGSFANYTMYRVPGTNKSAFNVTIPAGIVRWRVYANNSNNVFNTTPLWTAELSKATPTLTLSAIPGWSVEVGPQTSVSCSADITQVTVSLYRDEVSVTNANNATLSVGKYVYKCNSTATQNYSSTSTSNTLEIKSFTKYLSIVTISSALKLVELVENSSSSIAIEVKNTGNLSDKVSFAIENINESWYKINATNVTLQPRGGVASFGINFSVGFVELKDYLGRFKISGSNETLYSNFTLRILPGGKTKAKINETFLLYKTEFLKLEIALNQSKSQNKNVTAAEGKYNELKSKLDELNNLISQNNYLGTQQRLDEIKSLLDATKEEFSKAQVIQQEQEQANLLTYVLIIAAVIVVGVLAYLFWPAKSQASKQQTKEVQNIGKLQVVKLPLEEKPEVGKVDIWNKMKDKMNEVIKKREKKFKYKYPG